MPIRNGSTLIAKAMTRRVIHISELGCLDGRELHEHHVTGCPADRRVAPRWMLALGGYAPMQYARCEQDNSQRDRRDDCESYHSHDQGAPSGTRDLTEIG